MASGQHRETAVKKMPGVAAMRQRSLAVQGAAAPEPYSSFPRKRPPGYASDGPSVP
jgi:hypothetical protein